LSGEKYIGTSGTTSFTGRVFNPNGKLFAGPGIRKTAHLVNISS
jgi:hypothetical protein